MIDLFTRISPGDKRELGGRKRVKREKLKRREKEKEHNFPKGKVKHMKVRGFPVQYPIYGQ